MSNSTEEFSLEERTSLLGLVIFGILSVIIIVVITTCKFGCEEQPYKRRISPVAQTSKGNLFQVSMYMSKLHFNLLDFKEGTNTNVVETTDNTEKEHENRKKLKFKKHSDNMLTG